MRDVHLQLRAFRTILLDPALEPEVARPHLDALLATLKERGLSPPDPPATLDRSSALAFATLLERAWAEEEAKTGRWTGPTRRRIVLLGWILVLLPLASYMTWKGPVRGLGPWRATYFADTKLERDPLVRRERKIDFHWRQGSPIPELPPDKYSSRFDTCVELDRSYDEVVFQLGADDGARLFVDGEELIDLWNGKRYRQKSATKRLAEGVHHLRVEHVENFGEARLQLAVSFDGERPADIPIAWMRYPGNRLEEDDPCGRSKR